ncbi:MAG: hypothetical protein AAGH83_07530 [Pseudomonadota bacterium]
MSGRRLKLTIDRVVTNDPGLTRNDLEHALRAEFRARLLDGGGVGTSRARESLKAETSGDGGTARGIARATLGALSK